jgi:hypothetical protein
VERVLGRGFAHQSDRAADAAAWGTHEGELVRSSSESGVPGTHLSHVQSEYHGASRWLTGFQDRLASARRPAGAIGTSEATGNQMKPAFTGSKDGLDAGI